MVKSYSEEDRIQMTQQSKFTVDELIILQNNIEKIKEICTPETISLMPEVKITYTRDFERHEGLSYGSLGSGYIIPVRELRTLWENKTELKEHNISYFKTPKRRWFYNTKGNLSTVLYADDASQKIEFVFPFWIDAENSWKMPTFRKFIQETLEYKDKGYPITKDVIKQFWTQDLSKEFYHKNPETNSIGKVVMDNIEDLRKILFNHLVSEQWQGISKTHSFKLFLSKNNLKNNGSHQESVKRYLKKQKNSIYILAEQYGYIRNASRLLRYQRLRDSVRHPDEVHVAHIAPATIYEDFKKALPMLDHNLNRSNECFETDFSAVTVIHDLNDLMKILDCYADKKAKRGTKQYWDSLEKDGILDKTELDEVQDFILKCNTIAHRNPDADNALQSVADSAGLTDILVKAHETHEIRIQRWLKETSRNTRHN